jgi:hypothetical protein
MALKPQILVMSKKTRSLKGKEYLMLTDEDSYIVTTLKATIISEADDITLVKKLTALIDAQENEILRVRVELLKDGNSNMSVYPYPLGDFRAKQIVESINGDGMYFITLVAAANFLAIRRCPDGGNEELLRQKFLEKGLVEAGMPPARTIRSKTPHPGSRS